MNRGAGGRGAGRWRFRLPTRGRQQIARDVDDELAFHIEMCAQELAGRGVPRDAARAEAERQFGDLEGTRAYCRDVDASLERRTRRAALMTELWQDLRYGARKLRTSPGFTVVAALTLALGIGANTAIFSVVHHLLLAPLPYPAAERLVIPWRLAPGGMMMSPSRTVLDAWRVQDRVFERVELHGNGDFTLAGEGEPEVLRGSRVSPGFAAMLGARPLVGRAFTEEDARRGAAPVVAIGSGLWKRRFGGRADVVGRTVVVDDVARTVVAVYPSSFDGPVSFHQGNELWVPLPAPRPGAKPAEDDYATPLARLRPGVADSTAESLLTRVAGEAAERTELHRTWKAKLMHPQEMRAGGARRALLVLLGAVGFVLLIACANVANLLLTRAGVRTKEIAVRVALGGGRGRLVRQLLVESGLLALLGGALGVLLAWWGVRAIVAVRPETLESLDRVRLEPAVLAFSAALSVLTGVLFGLYPALLATRSGVGELIRSASLGGGRAVGGRRFRGALVAAEVALSAVILVGAGLLVRTVVQLERVDAGFDPRNVLSVSVALPKSRYATDESRAAFQRELLEGVRTLPGVEGATLATGIPPRLGMLFGRVEVEGRALAADEQARPLAYNAVMPDYFRVMRIRVLEGRAFTDEDRGPKGRALILNASLARKHWPNESAVGKRMRLSEGDYSTVVGVVADVAAGGLEASDEARFQVYLPLGATDPRTTLVVRTAGDPLAVVPLVKQRVLAMDRQIPLRDVATAQALLRQSISRQRFNMALLTTFAALALLLAAVGLYGVISYAVAQRTREIGIRVALGARPSSVQRAVVLEGVRMTAAGLVVGVAGALALSKLLASLLFGVTPRDPATYAAVAALLTVVTLVACWIPARRAAGIDPLAAIRAE